MQIPVVQQVYRWKFILRDTINDITREQDRSIPSFPEFIADQASSCSEIDWDHVEVTRIDHESGIEFTLSDKEFREDVEKAKQILWEREADAKEGREALESMM